MKQNKENLLKLISLIKEISNQTGNEWFIETLLLELGPLNKSNIDPVSNNINSLHNDLRRTKLFLKNIDKSNHVEGFNFYNKVVDKDLRINLINDYKEMKLALIINDKLEYARRMAIQLERSFDYIIEKTNGWNVVTSNPDIYNEIIVPSGNFDQKFKVKDNFFKIDINDRDNKVKKETSEIEFKSKAVYCFTYYKFDFIKYFSNFSDIYFLRNKASHASLSLKDKSKFQKIESKFAELNIYYNKMFQSYLESLTDLYK